MSRHREVAAEIAAILEADGARNGQRWIVSVDELAAVLEKHYAAPKPPAKKKAAKKAKAD